MANIGELPYRVPSWDSQRKLNLSLCVYVLAKQRRKRKFSVVFIQVVKKSALRVQNFLLFFYLLIGLVSFDVLVVVAVVVAAAAAVARSSLLGIRPRFCG